MFPIWYVLRCEEGNEKRAVELLKRQYQYSDEAEVFLVTFERMKRYEGGWHRFNEMLFRGCVFAEADGQKRLDEAASKTAVFLNTKEGGYSLRLPEAERKFLADVGGDAHHIAMSKGFIKDGITFVTEGPLCGKERKIRKIDRHKRMARIDSLLECYQKQGLWMGLEITAKS